MSRVPNQKRIITHKVQCDSTSPYTVRRRDIEAYAGRTLTDAGLKMWLYMSANKDGYEYNLSPAAVENEYGIKIRQYRNGIQDLIDKGFILPIQNSNDYDFIEYPPVYTSRIDEKVICDNEQENSMNSSVYTPRIDENNGSIDEENSRLYATCRPVYTPRIDASIHDVQTSSIRDVQRNNIDNINNNINNSIELPSHNYSTKVENCFKESYHQNNDRKNIENLKYDRCDTYVAEDATWYEEDDFLSKDEIREIITSDGDIFNLPIRNILDGLSLVLKNKQNENVVREIREECDLTEEQKKMIDDTLFLWEF